MEEPNDREQRRSAEGVRIIGAEEAQAALDAGAAAGRRPDDELRFGDVPPAPSGPRPRHRFPLPDSVDPAEAVPRPPVVAPVRGEERPGVLRAIRPIVDPEPPAGAGPQDMSGAGGTDEAGTGIDADEEQDQPVDAGVTGGGHVEGQVAARRQPPGAGGDQDDGEDGDDDYERWAAFAAAAADPPERQLSVSDDSYPWSDPQPGGPPEPRSPWERGDPGDPPPVPAPSAAGGSDPVEPPAGGPARRSDPPTLWLPEASAAHEPQSLSQAEPAAGPGGQPDPRPEPVPPEGEDRLWLPPPPRRPEREEATAAGPGAPAVPGAAEEEEPPASGGTASSTGAGSPGAGSPGAGGAGYGDPGAAQSPGPDERLADAEQGEPTGERIDLSGHSGPELPHWTDPPTGEVPRILIGERSGSDDDLSAWQALGSRGLRWRDEAGDWDDVEELQALGSEETRVGALDTTRSEHSDLFSFDEEFERLEEERSGGHPPVAAAEDDPPPRASASRHGRRIPTPDRRKSRARPGARQPQRPRPPGPPSAGSGNLASRVGIGAGLVALVVILYFVGPIALLVLSALIIGGSAAEGYGMLQRAGFRPATLLGLVASIAIVFGAYWKGVAALPLIMAITFVVSMLWYLLRIVEARPLANVAVTNLIFLWVGVLGSYAALLLRAHAGRGLFLGAVVTAVGADIVAYFAGRGVGSRQMAPLVSPGKTWEGATLGFLAAVVIGAIVGHSLSPWGGIKHGLVLGAIIGIIAPIGDLAESMVKRDLGIKDSGTALGGHGGLLDRFDSILLVLPAAYYLASYTHILK